MIVVKKVKVPDKTPTIEQIEQILDSNNVGFHSIDKLNWPLYPYKPSVKFRIAYSGDEIFIQYVVNEKYVRALFSKDEGSQPYKDSCVEFFIIPGSDIIYYNLEMNCIGVGTFAGGAYRKERTRFGNDVTSQIRRSSTLGKEPFNIKEGNFDWRITIALPISLFSLSTIQPLEGRIVKANFYKCGDELTESHYLSWNEIGTEKPNFHTPDFFGDIYFEK